MSHHQETMQRNESPVNSIPFQQKITLLSLVMTIGTTLYYFVNVWSMQPIAVTNNIIPTGYDMLIWNVGRLFILSQLIWHLLIGMGSGAAMPHEKMAAQKAAANAYIVLSLGLFAVVASFFWGEIIPLYSVDLAVMGFALAEIVKFGSQLLYTRRENRD